MLDHGCTKDSASPMMSMDRVFHLLSHIRHAKGKLNLVWQVDAKHPYFSCYGPAECGRTRKGILPAWRDLTIFAISHQSVKILDELCRLPQGIEALDAQMRRDSSFPPVFALRRQNCAARKAASEGWEDAGE
jgi:hypothetical protein